MSGSIFPALAVQPPNVLGALHQAAQTGLVNEQARTAEIANQGADLNLQLRKMFLEPFLRPQQPAQGGAAPGGGGGGGNVLAGMAPGGGGGPAAPGGQGSASAPGAAAAGAPVSPFGAVSTPFGVPMPAGVLMGVLQSQNPDQAVKQALDMRRQRLYERAAQATDVKSWNTALEQSYREGWVDTPTYNQLWNRFDLAPKVVQSLASPEAYLGYLGSAARMGMEPDATGRLGTSPQIVAGQAALEGAKTGAVQAATNSPQAIAGRAASAGAVAREEAGARSDYETVTIPTPEIKDGKLTGNVIPQTIRRSQVPLIGGASTVQDRAGGAIIQQESGGNSRVGDSVTGAVGIGQIQPVTWAQYARPGEDIRNPADNQRVSRRIIDDLWGKSGGDAARVAVGYFSGPDNIAPPGSPNPWKEDKRDPTGKTTSAYVADVMKRIYGGGGGAPAGAAPSAPGATSGPGAHPSAVGVPQATPIVPGAIPGKPELSPQNQAALEAQKKENDQAAEALGKVQGEIINAAAKAPVSMQRLQVLERAAEGFRPGASAQVRADAGKVVTDVLQGLGIKVPDWLANGTADAETIQKEGGYLAAEMTRALGSREAASVYQSIRSIQPNLTMSQGGFQVIVNSIRSGLQRDMDLDRFRQAWLQGGDVGGQRIEPHASIDGMTQAFNKARPVEMYASWVLPAPMPVSAADAKVGFVYRLKNGSQAMWDGTHFVTPGGG